MNVLKLPDQVLYAVASAYGICGLRREVVRSDLKQADIAELNELTQEDLLRLWSQWHLGYAAWADEFMIVQKAIREAESDTRSTGVDTSCDCVAVAE